MERNFYVYVWYRGDNNEPFYVGKGTRNRFSLVHGRNDYFMKVYRKHGGKPVKLIEHLTEQEAMEKEIELIKQYREIYPLTNITNGGEGTSGLKHSEKTKRKLSGQSKKQWSNPEMRKKLCESRRKTHSDPEFRANMSRVKKGKRHTPEQISNIRKGMQNPHSLARMSKAKTKYVNVVCSRVEDGQKIKVFKTTKEAAKWLESLGYQKPNVSSVIGCISGKNKTSYGFKWSADNLEESS